MARACAARYLRKIECFARYRSPNVKIQPTRNLDIAALRAFLAVVDLGGVGRAASALGLSQAAISQQIRRLEIAPGCRPFRRHGRGLALSP